MRVGKAGCIVIQKKADVLLTSLVQDRVDRGEKEVGDNGNTALQVDLSRVSHRCWC